MVVLREADTKELPEVDMCVVADEDMEEGERPPTCFNCGEIGLVSRFCTKPCMLCAYCYSPKHVTEDCLILVKKWEEKKIHCNMVHAEPHINKKDAEVDVRVITRGGAKTGREFEQVESSGKKPKGKIRKKAQPPPKFDAT